MTSEGSDGGKGGGRGHRRVGMKVAGLELRGRLREQNCERMSQLVRVVLQRRNGGLDPMDTPVCFAHIQV